MSEQQTPANVPPPGDRGGRNWGARLAWCSLWLAIPAPAAGVLSILLATSGIDCSADPYVPPSSFALSLSWLSIPLYYGAILASVLAVICGGMALLRARRHRQAQSYSLEASVGIGVGLLFGALLVYPGYALYSLLYNYGSQGLCLS